VVTTTAPRALRYGTAPRVAKPAPGPRPGAEPAGASDPRRSLEGQCRSTSLQAQQAHHAVAGQTFGALHWMPGMSVPTRLAQSTHDALSHGLYAAFRQGCGALFSWAGQAEQWIAAGIPGLPGQADDTATDHPPARRAEAGAAIARMSLHLEDRPLRLAPGPLSVLKERVCVFIHGLACDEHSWHFDPGAWGPGESSGPGQGPLHYGSLLSRDLGFSALYLRYNTSLSLEENGRHLSALLSRLVELAPGPVRELVLIGHSLGGLLARGAADQASREGRAWAAMTPVVICLGAPHEGAPATRGAPVLDVDAAPPVAPGLARKGGSSLQATHAVRLVAGNLADDSSGHLLGHLLGDGFVSAQRAPRRTGHDGDVRQIELAGLTHMALLNHPRVYALIHDWLRQPSWSSPAGTTATGRPLSSSAPGG
jgi:hypothetical protein